MAKDCLLHVCEVVFLTGCNDPFPSSPSIIDKQVCPAISLRYVPIAPLRLVPGTLTAELIHRQDDEQPFKTGYITIDHARMVLPMVASDPMRKELPLVGIWIKNAHGIKDTRIYTACLKYVFSTDNQRMDISSVLVAIFPNDGLASGSNATGLVAFHECHYDVKDENAFLFGGQAAISFDVDQTLACHMEVLEVTPSHDAKWRESLQQFYAM